MKKILVLGGSSYLASRLVPVLKARADFDVTVQTRDPKNPFFADPNHDGDLLKLIQRARPEFIINLIAETNVDRCEHEPDLAYQANVAINAELRKIQQTIPSHVIYISSDHLYNKPGKNSEPNTVLCNEYARTKLLGEEALAGGQFTVLRTNFYGKSFSQKPSFTDWICRGIEKGEPFKLFSDIVFSAVHVSTLTQAIERVIDNPYAGVFNLGAQDCLSKADFILQFAANLAKPLTNYEIVESSSVANRVVRPRFMAMNSDKFQETFDFTIGTMSTEIEKAAKDYL